jgi:hypothetical protein
MPATTLSAPPAPTSAPPGSRPRPGRPSPCRRDAALYGLSAAFAAATAGLSTLGPHREWAAIALAGYLAGAVASLVAARRPGPSALPARIAILAAVLAAVVVLPIVVMASARVGAPFTHAQEEVAVVEAAGRLLVATGSPYLGPADLGASSLAYFPYLPGMALFGLPAALLGDSPLADARLWFLLATVAALAAAARLARLDAGRAVTGAQILLALPWAALTLATGGDDLPVLGLSLLAVALAQRGHAARAGLVAGAAAALKPFAWPLLLVLAVALATGAGGRAAARRFGAAVAGVVAAAVGPVLALHPGAMVANTIAFPFGLAPAHSPAASPLPGALLAHHLPHGKLLALVALALAAATIGWSVLTRPPASPAGAATVAGIGLAVAMLLAPSTRFGYALYPIALLTAARLLPAGPERSPAVRSGVGGAGEPVSTGRPGDM